MGGWWSSNDKPENKGENQNILKVSNEIRQEFNEKHEAVMLFLIAIVFLLSIGMLYLLYSKLAARSRRCPVKFYVNYYLKFFFINFFFIENKLVKLFIENI